MRDRNKAKTNNLIYEVERLNDKKRYLRTRAANNTKSIEGRKKSKKKESNARAGNANLAVEHEKIANKQTQRAMTISLSREMLKAII